MGKITCAVADDNERMLNLISDVIATDKTFENVGRAKDGEQLLGIIREKEPDVVLLDLIMPNKDGIYVLDKIKEEALNVNIIVIYICLINMIKVYNKTNI